MPILRVIHCSLCDKTETETAANVGWPKWGAVQGIILDGEENPCLCPEHLAKVADFIDEVKNGMD